MQFVRARLRPMLRVETVVLVVDRLAHRHRQRRLVERGGRGARLDRSRELAVHRRGLRGAGRAALRVARRRWRTAGRCVRCSRVIVVASAATAYFMRTYAVMMDPTMIQNILKTDTHEARELMSWSMVGSVLLWSALPVAFIWWVRIEHRPWLRSFFVRVGIMAGALVVAVLSVLLVSRDLTSLMRNQRELRYLITPGNYHLRPGRKPGARCARCARSARARGHRRAADSRGDGAAQAARVRAGGGRDGARRQLFAAGQLRAAHHA